jgi:hypothetical protein
MDLVMNKEHALDVCTKVRSEVEDKKAHGFSFYWFVVRIGAPA